MAWGDFSGSGWTASQVALAASTAAVLAVTLYSLRRRPRPAAPAAPDASLWRKAGTLADITCYPIKSCGGVSLKSSHCSVLGLQQGFLRDRVFMVVREGGAFISGHTFPKLTQIYPAVEGSIMTLRTQGMSDITVDIAALPGTATDKSRVWGQTLDTVDCGDAVAEWLSRALLDGADAGLRLAYFPGNVAQRQVKPQNSFTEKCSQADMGAFQNETSFCLMSAASVADLNTRLERPVPARQFRASLLMDTEKAFAEDDWSWVRIGDVVFKNILPCTRCLFTTVDPDTGIKSEDGEPLKTLQRYRLNPAHTRFVGQAPWLGIHLALVGAVGDIAVGDAIFVQ